ncbi:transcription factor HES-4-like [Penaeus chinensis]|uniref:transcription factor HES-4-like n=1 Tax=Penaeus chinensis TaxID=139456 RepID=UPI001FB7DD7C|nr:transcription factor HES-4-like [Penaeus chinensis]
MCSSTSSNMADSQKTRRSNKPLMERRRRERINHCLNELKNLVLTAQRKDPTRYSKLEKADILEMTVRHVQALHRHDSGAPRGSAGSDSTAKYRAGFTQCASEVSRFLAGVNGLPADLHTRVMSHLSTASTTTEAPSATEVLEARSPASSPQHPEGSQASLAGVPLIQARLPSGQLALVLPSWASVPSGNVSPVNAASPEAAGTPSSPESARGSPQRTPDSFEGRVSPYAYSGGEASPSPSVQDSPADPQLAPLDLATPHRRSEPVPVALRRQHAITVQVESPQLATSAGKPQVALHPRPTATTPAPRVSPKQGPVAAPKAPTPCQWLREARHTPYPAHHRLQQQNPHWRPW